MSHIDRQILQVRFTLTGRFQKVEQLFYADWEISEGGTVVLR